LRRWWLAIVGIVGLLAGLVAFASPGLTALVFLMFIAGWVIGKRNSFADIKERPRSASGKRHCSLAAG
jgi:hypothetical protein